MTKKSLMRCKSAKYIDFTTEVSYTFYDGLDNIITNAPIGTYEVGRRYDVEYHESVFELTSKYFVSAAEIG
jgi:hypothetical protein